MVILAHQFLESGAIAALRLAYQDVIVNAPQSLADHVSPKRGCTRGTAYRSHRIPKSTHTWDSCPPTLNPELFSPGLKTAVVGICLSTFAHLQDALISAS